MKFSYKKFYVSGTKTITLNKGFKLTYDNRFWYYLIRVMYMKIGYARVSTEEQNLNRQIGVPPSFYKFYPLWPKKGYFGTKY